MNTKNPTLLIEDFWHHVDPTRGGPDYRRDFERFCAKYCDGLYTPGLLYDSQASGYQLLREMIILDITPASDEECEEWRKDIFASPNLKYLEFLHPKIRPFIRKHWHMIREFETRQIF
jgi:hypothetical protein